MSNVFVFDPTLFKELYPQFANMSDTILNYFFEKAETLLDNSETACIPLAERKILFYLLVAHYAALQDRINQGNSGLVGRIASATTGTVSIGTDYGSSSPNSKWYDQTPYGAEYWAMIAKYKNAIYIVAEAPMPVDRYRFH